jgi:hypothetical protein
MLPEIRLDEEHQLHQQSPSGATVEANPQLGFTSW